MLKLYDSMDHYDEDMMSFTQSRQYQAVHTRNNEEIELLRKELSPEQQIFFNRLLNHLSDEYADLALASYEAGLERANYKEEAYENKIKKKGKASEL